MIAMNSPLFTPALYHSPVPPPNPSSFFSRADALFNDLHMPVSATPRKRRRTVPHSAPARPVQHEERHNSAERNEAPVAAVAEPLPLPLPSLSFPLQSLSLPAELEDAPASLLSFLSQSQLPEPAQIAADSTSDAADTAVNVLAEQQVSAEPSLPPVPSQSASLTPVTQYSDVPPTQSSLPSQLYVSRSSQQLQQLYEDNSAQLAPPATAPYELSLALSLSQASLHDAPLQTQQTISQHGYDDSVSTSSSSALPSLASFACIPQAASLHNTAAVTAVPAMDTVHSIPAAIAVAEAVNEHCQLEPFEQHQSTDSMLDSDVDIFDESCRDWCELLLQWLVLHDSALATLVPEAGVLCSCPLDVKRRYGVCSCALLQPLSRFQHMLQFTLTTLEQATFQDHYRIQLVSITA